MPVRESQKQAQKRYVEKNKEKLAAYKAKYWLENKHRWVKPTKRLEPESIPDQEPKLN